MKKYLHIYLTLASFLLGMAIIFQSRAYWGVNEVYKRNIDSNVFQEIKLLKENNEDLESEVESLEKSLAQLSDKNSALEGIEIEIEKYNHISGGQAIFGPGVNIELNGDLTVPWMVDIVNELFGAGAQAVSVNGIRITNSTVGFDSLPKGGIILNGSIVNKPYEIQGIGEPSKIQDLILLPGGIIDRLKLAFPEIEVEVSSKEIMQMS